MKLSNATLRDLPDPILRPSYDRSALTPGILHTVWGISTARINRGICIG